MSGRHLSLWISKELLQKLDDHIREKFKIGEDEDIIGLRSREVKRYIAEGIEREKPTARIAR